MTKKVIPTNFKTIVKYFVEGITTETKNENHQLLRQQ